MQPNITPRRRVIPAKAGTETLVLTGPARLNVHRGRLTVEDGYANLGTSRTLELEPPLRLRAIYMLSFGGLWSNQALELLAYHKVPLYRIHQSGRMEYCISPPGGTVKPELIRVQAGLPDTEAGLSLAKWLITEKVQGQELTLRWIKERAVLPGLEGCISVQPLLTEAVTNAITLNDLRLAEGRAADLYFTGWKGFPVSFQKPSHRCVDVPEHWRSWRGRQSLLTGANRDATDPINALLNFSYAVAAGEVHRATQSAGLEPSLGILHCDKDGRESFIYDLLEPIRPVVDRLALKLITTRTFKMNRDFILLREGICRLGIELASEVAAIVSGHIHAEAERVVETVKHRLLSAKAEQVPSATAPDAHSCELVSSRCIRCGRAVEPQHKYCDDCRSERFAERNRKRWASWKAEGIDPCHGGEAAVKRGEAIARSNRLKVRRGNRRSE